MTKRYVLAVALLLSTLLSTGAVAVDITPWNGRSLKSIFDAIHTGCPQGPPETVTEETMLNNHDWWEQSWGRSDASWPRRGFSDCWANRGTECALPDRDNVVCLPGSRRGSTIAKGWALDPKGQACKPGVHCLYACEPGYYWTTYNQKETSNYDQANAHKRGHCDGTWNYGTSTHGVLCKKDGTLDLPKDKPLCALGETYVYAENKLDTHVFLCQTVFPGHEIFLIPTLIKPGESVMITTQPVNFWHGPSYSKPTHGDFYVSFAGADIMEACTWDEFSPSGAALLPYEIGSGVEDNGAVYSTHYFYQQPNSEVPATHVGYQMDLECESSEPGVCGPVFRSHNVVKADVLKKPKRSGSTKVKFVFRKPHVKSEFGEMYKTPARNHLQDLTGITGLTRVRQSSPAKTVAKKAAHRVQPTPTAQSYGPPQVHTQSAVHSTGQPATASATAVSNAGGNQNNVGYSNEHSFPSTSFQPDFTSGGQPVQFSQQPSAQAQVHAHAHAHAQAAAHGRRLKHTGEKSHIYLHNTLSTPIVICSKPLCKGAALTVSLGGDSARSAERGTSVGPGEKIQLEKASLLKISTQAKKSGSCRNEAPFDWHIVTGTQTDDEALLYTYTQQQTPRGHRLALKCVSEEDNQCSAVDARSVAVPVSRNSASPEITFVVKSSSSASPSVDSPYAWGNAVHHLFSSLMRSAAS